MLLSTRFTFHRHDGEGLSRFYRHPDVRCDERYSDALFELWPRGGFASGPDVYRSVSNNPINKIDPLGLSGESSVAAEGRVAHSAIQEAMEAQGALREQAVPRASEMGRSDVLAGRRHSEIKPASLTGVAAGNQQLDGIPANQRGNLILYRQTGNPQTAGGGIDYVRLGQQQRAALNRTITANGLTSAGDIFNEAAKLAEHGVQNTEVSEAAASQAGRVHYRGQAYGNTGTSPEGSVTSSAKGAASAADGAAGTGGTGKPGGMKGALGRVGGGVVRSLIGIPFVSDVITFFKAKSEGQTFQEEIKDQLRESPVGPLPGMSNPFYDYREAERQRNTV